VKLQENKTVTGFVKKSINPFTEAHRTFRFKSARENSRVIEQILCYKLRGNKTGEVAGNNRPLK
jgi:hypothetical protein